MSCCVVLLLFDLRVPMLIFLEGKEVKNVEEGVD